MTIPTTTPGLLGRDRTSVVAMLGRIAVTGSPALAVLGSDVPAASAGQSQQIAEGHSVRCSHLQRGVA